MDELTLAFERSQQEVKQLPSRPSNDQLLSLYGLFKQATQGDVTGSAPSVFKMAEHAKYQAWKALIGTDSEECKQRYVELVQSLVRQQG
ncbi:acyl-CoA-binding protein [Ferrimonas sediminicola]|uniref:Acyl-CoA-binding protein n=1 Tax=Ferrimonas sediminicola TaxID=2569538 RepID=A0A4U1BJQ2_9GAMM|nr:acyl-CoA-binding protein [Ferrimonas sediminicola]TKB50350.1 acyl-CoA-binding protein [Ferrimonas sediminicola]